MHSLRRGSQAEERYQSEAGTTFLSQSDRMDTRCFLNKDSRQESTTNGGAASVYVGRMSESSVVSTRLGFYEVPGVSDKRDLGP